MSRHSVSKAVISLQTDTNAELFFWKKSPKNVKLCRSWLLIIIFSATRKKERMPINFEGI